jgi:hypothetical protein
MTTLTTEATKGSPLTKAEADANFKRVTQLKPTAYTVAESDNRDVIEVTGTTTITLPDATAIIAAADTGDFEVTIKNTGTNTVTITCTTGTDTINGSTSDLLLSPADNAVLKVDQAGTGYNQLNSTGNLQLDRATTQKRISFTNDGTNDIYFYGIDAATNYNVGLYDNKNGRGVWNYSEATDTFEINSTTLTQGGIDVVREGESATTAASGTSVTIGSINSFAKRVIITIYNISGSSVGQSVDLQLGASGGIETTGYQGRCLYATNSTGSGTTLTTGILSVQLGDIITSGSLYSTIDLTLHDSATNEWLISFATSDPTSASAAHWSGTARKALSGTLTQVRFSLASGNFTSGDFKVRWFG